MSQPYVGCEPVIARAIKPSSKATEAGSEGRDDAPALTCFNLIVYMSRPLSFHLVNPGYLPGPHLNAIRLSNTE